MGKEPTPLEKVTKDADLLRKQVEKITKESLKNANNKKLKDREVKLKANFRSCYELKPQITELLQRAEELTEENEGPKVKNFEQKKKKETDRITTWQTQVDDAMAKVLPDEEGTAYLKELKKELGEGDEDEKGDDDDEEEDDEEEEEEEEEDEEDDEEDDEEGDETAGETLETPKKVSKTEKGKPGEDDDEEIEEEVDEEEETEGEEEVEEEETEEEEDEEQTTPKKIVPSKTEPKTAKKTEEEDDDDDEEEEDEDDEEEDDDEEDEDEESDKEEGDLEVTTTGRLFEAIYDFSSKEKGDLNFKAGEVLTIITTQEDGWWEAENEKGEKGSVPSTYLKMYNKYKDVQQSDEEEEEDNEEDEDEEEEGEEGTEKKSKSKKPKSGKQLWGSLKKAVNETSVTDVLHAMGAVPSGFRVSTLGQKFNSESIYQMKNYLTPKLSNSNFSYRDLFFDPSENKIRAKIAREQRIVTLVNCRQIPTPGAGLEIKSRHVRMCLFDGQNILSNIHTVKVTSVDREQRTWSFSTRVNDMMDTYQHGEVFIRTSNIVPNIGILFEMCASYVRTSTKEKGEFSCGWTHLPLEDPTTGQPVQNKTYDLYMNGGTPYEKGIEVDPSISRRTSTNALMSFISGNKQPRVTVKLSVPKKEQKDLIDTLPDTLIGNLSLLQMYSYYRQILADTLLRDRLDLESAEIIHSPWLATFPIIADQHDMMKLLRDSWIEKLKGIRRADMIEPVDRVQDLCDFKAQLQIFHIIQGTLRDAEFMKDTFKKVISESVYPLLHSARLPPYKSCDINVEERRHEEIERFKLQKLTKRGILALLLSSDMTHKPVDMKEVSFNAIGPYCLSQKTPPPVTVES
ncbi:nephrocystin-1-like isoform X1 [Ruditapes philippinarum]|uniref:nephrocystin-1-like isoform X1 n=1 Tax=Ruditapes philippinarum TaxID=129788 RepID=UPI00295BCF94|nr:nephrocystin-1-like isoform X1 [Ruditapes philippinarum]